MVAVWDLASNPEETHEMLFEHDSLRTVQLQLDAGESLPSHEHPESMVLLHVLEGRIELSLDGEGYDLCAGQIVQFGGDQEISPAAPESATALIAFAESSQ